MSRNLLYSVRRVLAVVGVTMGLSVAIGANAQEVADSVAAEASPRIEEHIANAGVIAIEMPEELRSRLRVAATANREPSQHAAASTAASSGSGRTGGYRIQIFADNNPRTAKNEARTRARNVEARFAEYPSYVEYKAPYWRTRVGNFRTADEAERAADEIKEAFPAYSREVRVVKDRIVVGE